jgi:hypothetical protein
VRPVTGQDGGTEGAYDGEQPERGDHGVAFISSLAAAALPIARTWDAL